MEIIEGGFTNDKALKEFQQITFYRRATWEESFTIFPTRCMESNVILWPFTKVMKGEAVWHGPGTPVTDVHYLKSSVYTYLKLSGKLLKQEHYDSG